MIPEGVAKHCGENIDMPGGGEKEGRWGWEGPLKGENPWRKVALNAANRCVHERGTWLVFVGFEIHGCRAALSTSEYHRYPSRVDFYKTNQWQINVDKQEVHMHGSNIENKDLYALFCLVERPPANPRYQSFAMITSLVRAQRKCQVQNKHSKIIYILMC